MSVLTDTLAAREHQTRERISNARRQYGDLLRRRHAPQPRDGEALPDVMIVLGLTPADVRQDVAALDAIDNAKVSLPSTEQRAAIQSEIVLAEAHHGKCKAEFEASEKRFQAALQAGIRASNDSARVDEVEREVRKASPRAFGRWPAEGQA